MTAVNFPINSTSEANFVIILSLGGNMFYLQTILNVQDFQITNPLKI